MNTISHGAVGLTIMAFPVWGLAISPLGFTAPWGFIVGVLCLAVLMISCPLIKRDKSDTFLFVFVFILVIGSIFKLFIDPIVAEASRVSLARMRMFSHLFIFLIVYTFYRWIKSYIVLKDNSIKVIAIFLSLTGLFCVVYGVYQFVGYFQGLPYININNIGQTKISARTAGMPRVQAIFREPGNLGLFVSFLIPSIVGLYYDDIFPKKINPFIPWLVFSLLVVLVFTFSRAALFGVLCGIIFGVLFIPHYTYKLLSSLVIPTVVGFLLGILYLQQSFISNLWEIIQQQFRTLTFYIQLDISTDVVFKTYMDQLITSFKIAGHNPLFGLGLGGWIEMQIIEGDYVKQSLITPKTFLTFLLSNTGLLGTILIMCSISLPFFNALRLISDDYSGHLHSTHCLALLGIIMMFTNFIATGGHKQLYVWFALAFLSGLNTIVSRQRG